MTNDWAQIIVNTLKESEISFLSGVPDSSLSKVINLLHNDDYFTVVPATREEEAIGIAAGAYVSGVRSAVYMQSSLLKGECLDTLDWAAHRGPISSPNRGR